MKKHALPIKLKFFLSSVLSVVIDRLFRKMVSVLGVNGKMILFLLLIGVVTCSFTKISTDLIVIDYKSYAEVFTPDKQIHNIAKHVRIVFKGDERLYITPSIKVTWGEATDAHGQVTEKITRTDTTYFVFAWSKGKKKGLKYSLTGYKSERGIVVLADSMFRKFGFTDAQFKFLEKELPATSTTVRQDAAKKVVMQALKKSNDPEPDSLYRYYDKDLNDIDFSFSKKLDAENNSKLHRVELIFNKVSKERSKLDIEIPRRVAYHEFVRVNERNIKKLEEIFEKAKTDKTLLITD